MDSKNHLFFPPPTLNDPTGEEGMFNTGVFSSRTRLFFGVEDVYISVAGHLCVLHFLILEDCSVWASGFLLAHGDC